MLPMHHYLYDKSDIILSKTDGFTVSMQMSVWQQSVLWVTSSVLWHVRVCLGVFGWHNTFLWKLL